MATNVVSYEAMSSRRMVTVYGKELKYEFLKLLRTRSFSLAMIGFPLMFYVLFGLSNKHSYEGNVHIAKYMLGGYACFGLIGAALFGIGVGLSSELASGWLELKRATMELDAAQNSFSNFRAPLADLNARVAISQRREQQVPTRQFRDSPERAQATYDEAVVNHNRAKQLYETGLISKQEMDVKETELRIAQDDLTNAKNFASAAATVKDAQSEQADLQARASHEELRAQIDELELKHEEAERRVEAMEVRATEPGVIAEVSVGLGDRVPGGTLLVRMAQLSRMVAAVPVAATMISQLRVGQFAMVQVPSSPPQQVEGKIRMISPLPSANMTHLIEIEFENETRLLLAGQPTEEKFVKP